MKRLYTVIFAMTLVIVGCSSGDKAIEVRIASASVPGDPHNMGMRKFVEVLNTEGDGKFKATFSDSSSLFSQDELLEALVKGNVEIVLDLAAQWFVADVPELGMFGTGYLFKNYDHMTRVLNGEVGKEIFEKIADEIGVRPLSAWYLGARQINLVQDKHVRIPADLNGVVLRMPGSESWLFLGRALGASPVPLPFSELYLALQQGTVDGQDNPLPTIKNAKFYEVTKSISITNHLIDSVWPSINEEFWQTLSAEEMDFFMYAMEEGRKVTDAATQQAESELRAFFEQEGLSVYDANIDAFRTHVINAYLSDTEMTSSWDMDLFEKINSQQ